MENSALPKNFIGKDLGNSMGVGFLFCLLFLFCCCLRFFVYFLFPPPPLVGWVFKAEVCFLEKGIPVLNML